MDHAVAAIVEIVLPAIISRSLKKRIKQ